MNVQLAFARAATLRLAVTPPAITAPHDLLLRSIAEPAFAAKIDVTGPAFAGLSIGNRQTI